MADLLAGLLTALRRPAQSASTAYGPVLERTAVYACELVAVAVRSSHQEFMLSTRQLPATGGVGAGDPSTLQQLLAVSLEDGSPQVRDLIIRLRLKTAHGLSLTLSNCQLGEAIIKALTALWRQAQHGSADVKTHGCRYSSPSGQAAPLIGRLGPPPLTLSRFFQAARKGTHGCGQGCQTGLPRCAWQRSICKSAQTAA